MIRFVYAVLVWPALALIAYGFVYFSGLGWTPSIGLGLVFISDVIFSCFLSYYIIAS